MPDLPSDFHLFPEYISLLASTPVRETSETALLILCEHHNVSFQLAHRAKLVSTTR